jgi:hypothetical protein
MARLTNRAIKNRLVIGNERFLTGIFVSLPFKEFAVFDFRGKLAAEAPSDSAILLRRTLCRK